ncbi:DNA primase [Aerococcus sanguinicola]|uniref:DNA primase n=1 Tax=Aerococcus sanguinicola TaxID=119206 RepID=A0A5N1GN24_9LACT|nr:DNA primase [Aerococcus sanguinicola]KAA9301716.1 DNA primase [Aerococcus sanguinicola]
MAKAIPNEVVQSVREQVDILDIVGEYVDLQKRGKNYFGKCPFHDERTPSFSVEADQQFFKCFSCGRGGNVFSFIMDIEGLSFPEAVASVAMKGHASVNFDFDLTAKQQTRRSPEEENLIAIHEAAKDFYHYLLTVTQYGQGAMAYLKGRGFSQETINRYQIGIAPEDGQLSYQHLLTKGFTDEALLASGIFIRSDYDHQLRDRFSGRLIFPLRSPEGETVAFSGRILPQESGTQSDQAKYLNSPETAIFQKSHFLFNLDLARPEIRRVKEVILFEGFMDVIKASEAGIKNGLASMGTSLTSAHIQMVRRQTKEVLLAYDGDKPGIEAAYRALDHFSEQAPDLKIQVCVFPDQMDPDEYIERYGSEQFGHFIVNQRLSVMHFYRYYYRLHYDLGTDSGKLQYIEAIIERIARLDSAVEQELYLKELSEETQLALDSLKDQLLQVQQTVSRPSQTGERQAEEAVASSWLGPSSQPAQEAYSPLEINEMHLFNRLLKQDDAWLMLKVKYPDFQFQSVKMQTLFTLLEAFRQDQGANYSPQAFYNRLLDQADQALLVEIYCLDMPEEVSEAELEDLVYNIRTKTDLKGQLAALKDEMEQAKLTNDQARIGDLNLKRIQILRQMKR